jgi:FkbM family methyltransferase
MDRGYRRWRKAAGLRTWRLLVGDLPMENLLNLRDFATMNRTKLEDAIRSRTQIAYLGENTALCRILGRYKFFVDTKDIGFGSHILLDGFWEMWLTQFMARYIKPGMKVVDLGANFGYYSILMSELVAEAGYCLCIEPNPVAAEKLAASLSINGFAPRSQVANCAAGDGSQTSVRFYVPNSEPKNARIVSATQGADERIGQVIEVPCKAVDEICGAIDHVDFIKIDAEGGEELVLHGMKALLQRDRPDMILEFNYRRYANPDQFISEIMSYYPELRYLDFDSEIKPLSIDRLASEQLGEDWLFFLSNRS